MSLTPQVELEHHQHDHRPLPASRRLPTCPPCCPRTDLQREPLLAVALIGPMPCPPRAQQRDKAILLCCCIFSLCFTSHEQHQLLNPPFKSSEHSRLNRSELLHSRKRNAFSPIGPSHNLEGGEDISLQQAPTPAQTLARQDHPRAESRDCPPATREALCEVC